MANIYSWQVTVTTAGTAVQGPDTGPGAFQINADPENTGYIYVGNDGANDVASTNGYKMAAGNVAIMTAPNMNHLYFDASVSGEKATILELESYRS